MFVSEQILRKQSSLNVLLASIRYIGFHKEVVKMSQMQFEQYHNSTAHYLNGLMLAPVQEFCSLSGRFLRSVLQSCMLLISIPSQKIFTLDESMSTCQTGKT